MDIGVIQGFLDGEIGLDERVAITDHIGTCDACSLRLSEAEDEVALVMPALAREMDSLVPTQRLWTRINGAIAEEQSRAPWWQTAWATLRLGLLSPGMAAAAGLFLVVGTFAIIWLNRSDTVTQTDGTVARVSTGSDDIRPVSQGPANTASAATVAHEPTTNVRPPQPVMATSRPASRAPIVEQAVYRPAAPAASSGSVIPGEDMYVRTISGLARTVAEQTDGGVMRPSERVAFEREMAVVNDAITRLKKEIKRNPRNEPAKQVLYASYQNKIDLLSSVAQKQELMASMD